MPPSPQEPVTAEQGAPAPSPPICLSVAMQMDPLWRHELPGEGFSGDLNRFAEDMTRYLVTQLERFGDPRGADLFLTVVAQRGNESATQEYRSGHYVKAEAAQGSTDEKRMVADSLSRGDVVACPAPEDDHLRHEPRSWGGSSREHDTST